ncbi:MAG: 4-hydroxybenzoate octaprenyltransferase [Gammaproteobacteria bacterium]|nr:4-hydroxybenzoate octaprenyltransferase [Gammaproteobacteria bacterium]
MRLDKPIGIFLLLWPTLWALWIAAEGPPPLRILIVFILGVIVMRSAGCVVNDIADRHVDGAVERTKSRPLVVGTLTLKQALVLFLVLSLVGLVLALQLNSYALSLAPIGLLLAIIYPFTKRVTHLPQLVLGAAFAWSIPMAFAAVSNDMPAVAWLLFGLAVLWPFCYDSIYALMDKEDDLKVGIKSTAILFGKWNIAIISALQVTLILGWLMLGLSLNFNWFYYFGVLGAAIMMGYQGVLMTAHTPQNYYRAFYNNHWVGCIIFAGIIFNYLHV